MTVLIGLLITLVLAVIARAPYWHRKWKHQVRRDVRAEGHVFGLTLLLLALTLWSAVFFSPGTSQAFFGDLGDQYRVVLTVTIATIHAGLFYWATTKYALIGWPSRLSGLSPDLRSGTYHDRDLAYYINCLGVFALTVFSAFFYARVFGA